MARLWVETDVSKTPAITIVNPPIEFAQGMELEPGRYEVAAAVDGIVPHTKWIELQAGEEGHLNFRLLPDEAAAIGAQKTAVSPTPGRLSRCPRKFQTSARFLRGRRTLIAGLAVNLCLGVPFAWSVCARALIDVKVRVN